tara:strand:+ start:1403 stop:2347 length:945 start_codon:yes stop_codon:yes gene_type:complete
MNLYETKEVANAIKFACEQSSISRTQSDVAAAGGIEFEKAFKTRFNDQRSESFPYIAMLKRDVEIANVLGLYDFCWADLKSYDNFASCVSTEWTNQSNADVIFFKIESDALHYVDAWSLKTTVAVDYYEALKLDKPKGHETKKTTFLDLVNVKTSLASSLLREFSKNKLTLKNAGRCLLVICNNGIFSSYFWDGSMSNICSFLEKEKAVITKDKVNEIVFKIPSFGTGDRSPRILGCSTRDTSNEVASTSFGRSLYINASATKKRKANSTAENLTTSGAFKQVTSGTINLKKSIMKAFLQGLSITQEKSHDNAA